MKNRLTALVLTFVLLFGCFSVLPVFAEEEAAGQQVKILAQNVVYGEKIQIAYALNCNVDEDVTVEYTVNINGEPVTYKAERYKENYTDKNGDTYPVYVTHGFHANQFTEVVEAVAYTGDTVPEDAIYKTYSVGQYFYAMLYKHNYISKTEGTDLAKKNLYLSAINYGTYAQDVLDKKDDTDPDTLLNRYCYLWAGDGVTINGDVDALVAPGTEVTLAGASSSLLIDNNGNTTVATSSYTAEAGMIANVAAVMDYENGASNNYVKSYDAEGNLITGNLPANANTLTMGLSTDGENTFLQVRNYKNSGKVGKTEVLLSNTAQTGNCYTLETKINVKGATAGYNIAQIKFVNNNNGEALNLFLTYATVDGKTGVAIATTGDNSSIGKATIIFDASDKVITTTDGWFTLRIEFYFAGAGVATAENTYMKLYVDDILAYDGLASWAIGANISHAQIDHISAGNTHNSCYDDIYFIRTNKAYVEGN